ncbi:MAG: hypothetical protein Q8R37_05570 [Nanoarchaeota archaeon]|nr:hypothetical protein [Nanoarchaeota archaeon]
MNQRGIMDDWFDFMFTLLAAFLLFILVHSMLIGSIEDQNQETVQKTEWAADAYNLILENKIREEAGQQIDIPELQQRLDTIQKVGIESPADFPDVGGY